MSSAEVERIIRKRRCYPVDLGDGDVIHLRSLMSVSELPNIEGEFRNDDDSIGYVIGCGLVNADRSQVFTIAENETPKEFGHRVLLALDLPLDTRAQIVELILKLSNGPLKPDDLKKN